MNATAYLVETNRCHGCGCRLTARHGDHRHRFYCSVECMRKAPPALVAAAEREGCEPREALLRALRGRTIVAAAGLLGVEKATVHAWIRQFRLHREVRWV